MRPAFSSKKEALAFMLMVALLILLPVLLDKSHLPPRGEIYSFATWRFGPFNHLRHQIFEEKSDIDILFIGSSRIWSGIDTPWVQQELSKKKGRPAVVLTLGWSWLGFDALYFIARDVLEHRKVQMIVFDDEYRVDDQPHCAAVYWFRYGENAEALQGLPLKIRASYYFAAILGMPQNLISLLRPNYAEELVNPEDNHWKTFYSSRNSSERLGALTTERNMSPADPFVDFIPSGRAGAGDVCVYSEKSRKAFEFTGPATPAWQLHFARKFTALAQKYGVRLVLLHLLPPYANDQVDTPLVREREFWPKALQTDVTMIGIPPSKLYSGINDMELPRLFYTKNHFNKNGMVYFTKLITPILLQTYEAGSKP